MIEYALPTRTQSGPGNQTQHSYALPVARLDDTDTATRDVPETDVEPAELIADDEEDAERLLRVLDLGQEVGCEPERERNLRRLVEVGLQDVPER